MNAEEFSRMTLNIDGSIRFSGIVEKSGHLYASVTRQGLDEHLKESGNKRFTISIHSWPAKDVHSTAWKSGFCRIPLRKGEND